MCYKYTCFSKVTWRYFRLTRIFLQYQDNTLLNKPCVAQLEEIYKRGLKETVVQNGDWISPQASK